MIEELRLKLRDPDEANRAYVAADAALDHGTEALDPLLERLPLEPSRFVRDAIVTSLASFSGELLCGRVLPLLESPDAFLRNAAVTLLQGKGDAAVAALSRPLESDDVDVRKLALDVLSAIGSPAAEVAIAGRLDDPDVNVRIAAVEYLGERAPPEHGPALQRLFARETEPMMLATILPALLQLDQPSSWAVVSGRFPRLEDVPVFLAPAWLRAAAAWGPAAARDWLFSALERIGPSVIDAVAEGLEAHARRFPGQALETEQLELLDRALSSEGQQLSRRRLLEWLGSAQPESAVLERLDKYLGDRDPIIRQGAALGLRRLGSPEAMARIARQLGAERDPDVRNSIVEMEVDEL